MATVSVIRGLRAGNGTQVMRGETNGHEVVTSSSTSTQSTLVAETNEVWEIACATALWINFGTNPTASAGTKFYVPAGMPRNFEAKVGNKVAVIDA